jgi:hypothetical protein
MFKAGDKVYAYRFGIVELDEHTYLEHALTVLDRRADVDYCFDGKVRLADKYPSIISLEEAEKRGFVRKKVMYGEKLQVKYFDIDWERYCFSCLHYECESDFRRISEPEWKFISFVDEKLNECNPPQETIEWEEIV